MLESIVVHQAGVELFKIHLTLVTLTGGTYGSLQGIEGVWTVEGCLGHPVLLSKLSSSISDNFLLHICDTLV